MKKYLPKIFSFVGRVVRTPDFWYFLVLTLIFSANALHEIYPDEFDNISGGKFILRGIIPYSGFLTHHGPFAYYLAAFLNLFSGVSFVNFRFVYAFFLIGLLYTYYRLIRSRFSLSAAFLIPYYLVLGFMATYFWLHMMLADSMSAIMLILPFFYLLLLTLRDKKLTLRDILIVSIPLAATLLTALTYSFFIAGLYSFLALLWLKSGHKIWSPLSLKAIGVVAAPYLIFVLYLVVTRSFGDYVYQNIIYNQQYYIDNYPRPEGQTSINPVRYAIVIAKKAVDQIADGAKHALTFNIYNPKEIPLLGFNLFLLITFAVTGNYLAIIPVALMLLFSTPRSNPLNLKEIDYQSAVYTVLSLGNGMFLLAENLKRKVTGTTRDFLLSAVTVVGTVYMLVFSIAMFQPFVDKMYGKFMGTAPAIYDRPEVAPAINLLVPKNEYAWVGPFAFEELYYMKARFPSNYHWLLPANAKSEKIRTEMMADFDAHKPNIIAFDRNFSAFGAAPSSFNYFMVDWINANYTLLEQMKDGEGRPYKCQISNLRSFRCDEMFYIRNDLKESVAKRMVELNLAALGYPQ